MGLFGVCVRLHHRRCQWAGFSFFKGDPALSARCSVPGTKGFAPRFVRFAMMVI